VGHAQRFIDLSIEIDTMGIQILFALLAVIAILCGVGVIANDNPVRSALSLVGVLISIAMMFFTLNASFIAAIQIIVYAGAIMVLFIFVIMLLNLGTPEQVVNQLKPQNPLAIIAGLIMVAIVAGVIVSIPVGTRPVLPTHMTGALEIGQSLFTATWVFPFEAVSILLLIATIGAVVLAMRRTI
jgi:NADH-quinone oxidoreductase subunit J